MGLLLLLLGLAAALLLRGAACGSSSHSLRYFYMGVSEPRLQLPAFTVGCYVDDRLLFHYDSDRRRVMVGQPWMEMSKVDPRYWDQEAQGLMDTETKFRVSLESLQQSYNQSGGLHTWQLMSGCELSEDKPSGGYFRYGYDGKDFITFNMETLTWMADVEPAKEIKRKWDAESENNLNRKVVMEETCIELLRKFLDFGRETVLRNVPPVVKVTRKDIKEGLETLLCKAHGFYPKEVNATWKKDGEVREENVTRGVVSPNADGTYYTWLSIEIDPKERSRYQCHVEHDRLQESSVERSVSVWLIVGGLVPVIMLVLFVAGIIVCIKKCEEGALYRGATSEFLLPLQNPYS